MISFRQSMIFGGLLLPAILVLQSAGIGAPETPGDPKRLVVANQLSAGGGTSTSNSYQNIDLVGGDLPVGKASSASYQNDCSVVFIVDAPQPTSARNWDGY